jgi:hypothetical protein
MSPTRYRKCLSVLRLSQRGLAPILRCSDRLTRDWAMGYADIPLQIAGWLEQCVAIRLANPEPPPPEDWRKCRPRFSRVEDGLGGAAERPV